MSDLPVTAPRWERGAESRFMAEADGWVMVRRPGCIPYTIFKRDWMKLPSAAQGKAIKEAYDAAAQGAPSHV